MYCNHLYRFFPQKFKATAGIIMTYIVYFLFRYTFCGGRGIAKNNKNKHSCNKPLLFDTINDVFIPSPGILFVLFYLSDHWLSYYFWNQ